MKKLFRRLFSSKEIRNPKQEHKGYRAKILIVDDLCDIDKEELKEILKERSYDNNK